MPRRPVIALLVVAAVSAGVAVALIARGSGSDARAARAAPSIVAAVRLCEDTPSQRMRDNCYIRKLTDVVAASDDPATEVPRIGAYAKRVGGYLAEACHIIMHGVGRAYGSEEHVTLARLQDVLPRSNDPSCSAGFAHGLIIALGPAVLAAGPKGALASCRAAGTRYEQYSCVHGLGHAYMRSYGELLRFSLGQCLNLGAGAAPDCAQGVFHDYWLSLTGSDGARPAAGAAVSPRTLCARQRSLFVRPCWYRAYLETTPPVRLGTTHALVALCRGLAGLQRSGCLTAGSVVSSVDPYEQTRICAALPAADAVSCVHGVRAQAIADRSRGAKVRLLRGCGAFPAVARAGCYAWLGEILAVVTDGRFGHGGCGALAGGARSACVRGTRATAGPLVTFS